MKITQQDVSPSFKRRVPVYIDYGVRAIKMGTVPMVGSSTGSEIKVTLVPGAPNWEVFTKADLADLERFDTNVPKPVPRTIGEAVAMIWEDGIALIYWNRAR